MLDLTFCTSLFGLENEALEAYMVVLVGHGVLAVGEEHRFDVAAAWFDSPVQD